MSPIETIEAVARLRERWTPVRSPFHLQACGGCGGPSFQQPCTLCGFYPMGRDKGIWHPEVATREYFEASVDRSGVNRVGGNLATWNVRSMERAGQRGSRSDEMEAAARIAPLLARAQALRGLTSPGEMFDVVARDGIPLVRPFPEGFQPHWGVLSDCMALMDHIVVDTNDARLRTSPHHAGQERLLDLMHGMVSAIHDDDAAASHEAAKALRSHLGGLADQGRVLPYGNLDSTLQRLDRIVADALPPPAPR